MYIVVKKLFAGHWKNPYNNMCYMAQYLRSVSIHSGIGTEIVVNPFREVFEFQGDLYRARTIRGTRLDLSSLKYRSHTPVFWR